jgi:DNA-binding NarL/FixJ family response regulator
MSVSVLLVDDHRIIREGLHICLEREDGIEVVGEAENGRDAVRLAQELKPDVVVMDITMPELNGIEATRQILHADPRTKVLGLSVHSDPRYVAEMLHAGASGYLLKDCAFEELPRAILALARGEAYLSPQISQTVLDDYSHGSPGMREGRLATLSARECEVLQLLAEGNATKEVAHHLHLSPKTVETHRQHLMEKLQMHSVAALTRYAIREGLTPLED